MSIANAYSSASRYRNNIEKDFCDKKKAVYLKRVDRTSAIYSSFNIDTPPSDNDELEPRDIILTDGTTVDRDNKGIITSEITSKDRINLDFDNDVSKRQTTQFVSKEYIHVLIEVNKLECDFFSVNETTTITKIII